MIQLLFLFLSVSGCWSQFVQNGTCNSASIPVVQNFNLTQFAGVWNQIERVVPDAEIGDCSTTTYTVENNANYQSLAVVNRAVDNGTLVYRNGTIRRDNNISEGRFTAIFPDIALGHPYLILATDYVGYALVYSCLDSGNSTHLVWAWKLSRNTTLLDTHITAINNAVVQNPTLLQMFWRATSHSTTDCRVNSSTVFYSSGLLVLLSVIFGYIRS